MSHSSTNWVYIQLLDDIQKFDYIQKLDEIQGLNDAQWFNEIQWFNHIQKDLVGISARGAQAILSSPRERSACILQT